jgi:NAD(P)-dependent dehydrogenase (short-subunit alcohol dehydrogenase family)
MHGVLGGRAGRPGDAILVTGTSTGLGLETALQLATAGFTVFATVRDLSQRGAVLQAAADRGANLAVLHLDLTSPESIDAAVGTVVGATGGIFGLVNNAGVGLRGAVEDCADDEIRHVVETNVLGTIAVTRSVLPFMRAAGCGRIVTVSSVGGRVVGFGVTTYCATKFAQEGLGEGLAVELAPFGIQSVLVEPGIVKTARWADRRATARGAQDPASPYHDLFWASEAEADAIVERARIRPEDVARTIHRALTSDDPRMRYVVGRGAAAAILARRMLPETLFERLYYGRQVQRLMRRRDSDSHHSMTPAGAPR